LDRVTAVRDLLAFVLLGGVVSTLYQWKHKTLTGRSLKLPAVVMVVSGVVAALIAIAAARILR
jgi:hypothetical protein